MTNFQARLIIVCIDGDHVAPPSSRSETLDLRLLIFSVNFDLREVTKEARSMDSLNIRIPLIRPLLDVWLEDEESSRLDL